MRCLITTMTNVDKRNFLQVDCLLFVWLCAPHILWIRIEVDWVCLGTQAALPPSATGFGSRACSTISSDCSYIICTCTLLSFMLWATLVWRSSCSQTSGTNVILDMKPRMTTKFTVNEKRTIQRKDLNRHIQSSPGMLRIRTAFLFEIRTVYYYYPNYI
jgi:hypothetical protein